MIKKGDFVKIDYIGKVDGVVFDTTDEKVAKANNLEKVRKDFKPIVVCVGEGYVIKGLDKALENREIGKLSVKIKAEDGFGNKSTSLLRMIPLKQFSQHKIKPVPGLELNIEGHYGVVRSVSGGRVIMDFNHPLAGKELEYDVNILEKVTNIEEQVRSILDVVGIPYIDVKNEKENIIIKFNNLPPQEIMDFINEKVKKLTNIKTVSFEAGKKNNENKEEKSKKIENKEKV